MAKDQYGNYVADLQGPALVPGGARAGVVTWSSGAPAGTPYPWQVRYINTDNGDQYVNSSGSWVKE